MSAFLPFVRRNRDIATQSIKNEKILLDRLAKLEESQKENSSPEIEEAILKIHEELKALPVSSGDLINAIEVRGEFAGWMDLIIALVGSTFILLVSITPSDISLKTLSDNWVILSFVFLSGIILYLIRSYFRIAYGSFEFVIGFILTVKILIYKYFDFSDMEIIDWLGILSGMYVMVRGLDNIAKRLRDRKIEPLWRLWKKFFGENCI